MADEDLLRAKISRELVDSGERERCAHQLEIENTLLSNFFVCVESKNDLLLDCGRPSGPTRSKIAVVS